MVNAPQSLFFWQMWFAAKWTNEAMSNLMGLLHKNVGREQIYSSPHSLFLLMCCDGEDIVLLFSASLTVAVQLMH